MTPAQREDLEHLVLGTLRQAEAPLSMPQIQQRLAAAGHGRFDDWDINQAVWGLIRTRRAGFTPRLYIKPLPSEPLASARSPDSQARERAPIELTHEQQQLLDQSEGTVRLVDPRTEAKYLLVPTEVYDKLKSAVASGMSSLAPLLAEFDPDEWEEER